MDQLKKFENKQANLRQLYAIKKVNFASKTTRQRKGDNPDIQAILDEIARKELTIEEQKEEIQKITPLLFYDLELALDFDFSPKLLFTKNATKILDVYSYQA